MIEQALLDLAENGLLPDAMVRIGIRRLLESRLAEQGAGDLETRAEAFRSFLGEVRASPVAVSTREANAQHYEVPAGFFRLMLGPRLKYSACRWSGGALDLGEAEEAMLRLTAERAHLAGAKRILELGCGWGSLTLWMAERFPGASITAVSNSGGQRRHIERECERRGLRNVQVVTADMNSFETAERFDRVVSVEMFEHMRNYPELMRRIASWMEPGGLLFVHLFCHREFAYFYEPSGPGDWMAREFFTGGTMPSEDLLLHFQEHLVLEDRWRVGGLDYARTLEEWLRRLDGNAAEARAVLESGGGDGARLLQRWRLFLMACAELFAYRGGDEWFVSHSLFRKRGPEA
jgi:cyclopropane-fatty-acyl-phospholipid synthase